MGDPADRSRVLVVDDDANFLNMIAEVLREKSHEVTPCLRPEEAVEKARDGSYAAAVVDLIMPGMGGFEVAEAIRAHSPDTQIVILTGHGDLDSAIAGFKHGIFDYLQKDKIDIKRLVRAVADATDRARLLAENRSLLAQLQEGNHRMTRLHETSARIGAEAHLDRLLIELVSSAKDLCHAGSGRAVLFAPPAGDRFVIEHAVGDGAGSLTGARLTAGKGIVTRVVSSDQALVSLDPSQDPQFEARIDALPTDAPGLVCAPLRRGRVRGALMVAGRASGRFTEADRDVLAILARHAAVAIENALEHERGLNFFTHTCSLLISLLDRIDIHYTGHSRETARLCDMVTRRLGLEDEERRNIHFAALLHDIGKLLIPADVLHAPTYTSDAQRDLIKTHPTLALDLLKPITMWEEILPMIHQHHERWDGKGYPLGAAGEAIPLGARIIAVAEAFDAMTRRRSHGPARTPDAGLVELEAFAGTQFDPKIVRLFVAEYRTAQNAGA